MRCMQFSGFGHVIVDGQGDAARISVNIGGDEHTAGSRAELGHDKLTLYMEETV